MRSRVMHLIRKRSFDFSTLVVGTTESVVAVAEVDVSAFGNAVLVVRVHANTTTGTGSTISVSAYSVAPSDEDPDVTFIAPSPAATVTISNGATTPAGTLLVAAVGEGFGSCLQIQVTGDRDAADTVHAEISVDLVARVGVGAPARGLDETLAVGNDTGGTDLVVSSTDVVRGDDGAAPTALSLRGGNADGGTATGAAIHAFGGAGSGTGTGGGWNAAAGAGGSTGPGGGAVLSGGLGGATSGAGGSVMVRGGVPTDGDGGAATLIAGPGAGTNRSGGAALVTAGNATGTGTGGAVAITAGTSPSGTPGPITLVHTTEGVRLGSASGPKVISGTGSPEGTVTAPVGSLYHRTDGGTGTSLYIKESGAGNTGWVAVVAGGLSISGSDNQIVRLDGTSAVQNTPNTAIDDTGNPTFSAASVVATFGDGTASPGLLLRKGASGTSSIEFRQTTSPTANDKRIAHASAEQLELQHWTGSVWSARLTVTTSQVLIEGAQIVEETVFHTVTGGGTSLTLNFTQGNVHRVNLNAAGATVTLTLSGPTDGARYRVLFALTDDNESHGLTWPSSVYWENTTFDPGTAPPTLDTTGDQETAYVLVDMHYDSTSGKYFARWGAFAEA